MGGKVTKPKVFADIQKEADKQLKGAQESVKTELTGLTESLKTEVTGAGKTLGLNTDQDFSEVDLGPIQDIAEAAIKTTKLPVQAVEDLTKIDVPKVIGDVTSEAVSGSIRLAQDAIQAASPILSSAVKAAEQPFKAVEDVSKIDAQQVAEDVLAGAANLATETSENLVTVAEEAVLKPASDVIGNIGTTLGDAGQLFIDNILSPFQPGTAQGTGSGQATGGDNLASAPTMGDPGVIPEMEQASTKAGQMTEEERLRRIRRLLLNRYGREDTILSGVGDTRSRRRYAL